MAPGAIFLCGWPFSCLLTGSGPYCGALLQLPFNHKEVTPFPAYHNFITKQATV